MERRLFKTGNSIVLSLPKEILDGLGLADGENVSWEFDRQKKRGILTPVEKHPEVSCVDENFAHQVNEFIEQYRPALEELAK